MNEENDDESQWETEDEEEEDGSEFSCEEEAHAIIYDYPVQIICLEKCKGTLDSMFENCEINEDNGSTICFKLS